MLALEGAAAGSSGKHTWAVRAEPAVTGLGFSLTLGSYVPWRASPARMALTLRQGLPAGVQGAGPGFTWGEMPRFYEFLIK